MPETTISAVTADAISKIEQLACTDPVPLEPNRIYAVRGKDGETRVLSTAGYVDMLDPRVSDIIQRTVTVWDAASFLAYVHRHVTDPAYLEVWCDLDQRTVTAIIDAPRGADPGLAGHVAQLRVKPTIEWTDWARANGQYLTQSEMAEFIEDHLPQFVDPPGAEMLEIATSIQTSSKGSFESAIRLESGQQQFAWREEIEGKAGRKGTLAIPSQVTIAMAPFQESPAYKITARFRYRVNGGDLRLALKIDRAAQVLETAFSEIVSEIVAGISDRSDVFNGHVD